MNCPTLRHRRLVVTVDDDVCPHPGTASTSRLNRLESERAKALTRRPHGAFVGFTTNTSIGGPPMSASENKAAVQAAYAAFSAGDIDGAVPTLADDIEWVVPGNSSLSGTYRGKQEVLGFLGQLVSKSFTTKPQHFIAEEDRVVVLTDTTTDDQRSPQADVLTFTNGKVSHFISYGDTALRERIWGTK